MALEADLATQYSVVMHIHCRVHAVEVFIAGCLLCGAYCRVLTPDVTTMGCLLQGAYCRVPTVGCLL